MASKPTVRWNESAGRWTDWVRFPDGARRKVERVDKAAAQRDLDELRAVEIDARDAGQAEPKTTRGRRRIGLHPLLVAALTRHREELELLSPYDDEGFVFCTRNATPISRSSLRRGFTALCEQAGLGREWTTYELRHSFVSLVVDQLNDLVKVADVAFWALVRAQVAMAEWAGRDAPSLLLLRPASPESATALPGARDPGNAGQSGLNAGKNRR